MHHHPFQFYLLPCQVTFFDAWSLFVDDKANRNTPSIARSLFNKEVKHHGRESLLFYSLAASSLVSCLADCLLFRWGVDFTAAVWSLLWVYQRHQQLPRRLYNLAKKMWSSYSWLQSQLPAALIGYDLLMAPYAKLTWMWIPPRSYKPAWNLLLECCGILARVVSILDRIL